jgi:large subunit ribosomal protein L23
MEPARVIVRPYVTEKALMLAEKNNMLTLIVDRKATKPQIKAAVEKLYGVKVKKVNTVIAPTGEKKAYVRLAEGFSAIDVLTRLGAL